MSYRTLSQDIYQEGDRITTIEVRLYADSALPYEIRVGHDGPSVRGTTYEEAATALIGRLFLIGERP